MNTLLNHHNSFETALFADMRTRFHAAIHKAPLLFHDVLKTGLAQKHNGKPIAYEIILLHGNNIDNDLLNRMMGLQSRIARIQASDPRNMIDYRSEQEIIGHYTNGGLGLAILGVDGTLIGQTILSVSDDNMTIGWLMVDKVFGKNLLGSSLIQLAITIAEAAEMKTISAAVRRANKKGINTMSSLGFTAACSGYNAKDGAQILHFRREAKNNPSVNEPMGHHFVRP